MNKNKDCPNISLVKTGQSKYTFDIINKSITCEDKSLFLKTPIIQFGYFENIFCYRELLQISEHRIDYNKIKIL